MQQFAVCSLSIVALIGFFGFTPAKAETAATAVDAPALGKQTPQTFALASGSKLNYLLYLPEDYDKKEHWPLVLFLHGAGERGDQLDMVKKHGPPKLIAAGRQFPFLVVAPQCPANVWWNYAELSALLDAFVPKYKVDVDRVYVTGLSMGGFATFDLAAHDGKRFAAAAPICGGGDPKTAASFAHLPIWVFHGGKDPVVPLARSQEMVDALKEAGGTPIFTVYPDALHDSWSETYDNRLFYDWLLAHRRKP